MSASVVVSEKVQRRLCSAKLSVLKISIGNLGDYLTWKPDFGFSGKQA